MLDSLNYLAYGAIGIAMATAVLAFRLLSREQKKEHPNESILKMIKWFIGLAVFFAVFFGAIEIFKGGATADPTVESAAKYLSESDSSAYFLNPQPGSQKAAVFMKYGDNKNMELGELSEDSGTILKGEKIQGKGFWEIAFGATNLGKVKVDIDEYRIIADSTHGKHFNVGKWYPLDESEFWFKINSISGKSPNYLYTVSYGEGREISTIIPSERSLEYAKTSDGFIFLNQPFKRVRNDAWKRQYYVKFGAGLATNQSTSVQKLNVQVIGVALE